MLYQQSLTDRSWPFSELRDPFEVEITDRDLKIALDRFHHLSGIEARK